MGRAELRVYRVILVYLASVESRASAATRVRVVFLDSQAHQEGVAFQVLLAFLVR